MVSKKNSKQKGAFAGDEQNIILDSIADGVFSVDKDWRISSFNRAAEKITGSRVRMLWVNFARMF